MHRIEPGFTCRFTRLRVALFVGLGLGLGLGGCGRTGLYSIEDDGGEHLCPPHCPDFGGKPGSGDGFSDDDGFPNGRDDMPPGGGGDGPPDGPDCHLLLEDCGNEVDDNCDGLIDCEDPGCAADKRCGMPGVEICNNGVDDDQNTFTDCADPACLNFPGCQPHMCDVNMPDCKDPACVNHPACQNLVCKPTVDFGALAHNDATSRKVISTVGTIDVAKTQCAPAGGGQVVATFEVLDNATTVRMDFTQPMNSDHAFGLFRAGVNQRCEANPLPDGCFDPKAAPSGTRTWILEKGRYYLIVIAVTKVHQGSADVTLTTPPIAKKETCNNGIDDDGNGLTDCADPVCINDPSCVKNICKPDVILGTIVPTTGQPQSGKLAQFDTRNGNPNFMVQCGGKGAGRVVQFTLAETAGIALAVDSDTGDHVFGLYRLPPLGQPCDGVDLKVCDLARVGVQEALGDYAPGTYLMIFQAIKPGDEGAIDVWIYTYKNKRVELCHNNIDDDNNGLTDCADPACANDQGCGPPICSPDVDFGNLVIGQPAKSTVLNLAGGVPNLKSACAMGGGRSRVVQFTLAASGGLQLGCNQQSGQAVMGLYAVAGPRDSCDVNELSCADPQTIPFGCNWIWPAMQSGTYYLIAQAFKPGDEGTLSLRLNAVSDRILEICNNAKDDDGDGNTDCADLKCALSPQCAKIACKADQTIDPMPIGGMMVAANLDTTGKPALAAPPCAVSPGGRTAVVLINLPQKANVKVDWVQGFGKTSHVIAVYPYLGPGLICGAGPALGCLPTMGLKVGTTTVPNVPAGKYWVVAAADQPGNEGPILLNFTATP